MTDTQRETLRTAFKIAGLVLVGLIGWAAARYDDSKLDVARFAADSSRRDFMEGEDHALLVQIEGRVTAMYCGHLSPVQQPGCQ